MPVELQFPRPILGSWKEIARFLRRDVRTVQRWERDEGLPVHRHHHRRRASVYADPDELDRWLRERGSSLAEPPARRTGGLPRMAVATLAAAGAALGAWLLWPAAGPREAPAVFGAVLLAGVPLVNPVSVALSPEGSTLYVSDIGAKAVFALAVGDGSVRELATFARTGFAGLDTARLTALSLDGRALYVAGWAAGSVFSVSTATGEIRVLASGPPLERPHGIAVSSDGTLLFVTDNYAGKVYRLPASGGRPALLAAGIPEPLDVAPVGPTLFVTSGEAAVYTLPATGGRPTRVASGPPLVRPSGIVATADASVLFFVDDAQFGRRPPAAVYSLPGPGGPATRLLAGPPLAFPVDLALTADGTSLYVADAGYGTAGAVFRLDLFEPQAIDVRPGTATNEVDPYAPGEVEVAILASDRLAARDVDARTARFGPRGVPPSPEGVRREDVNGDGRADLVLRFAVLPAGLPCGSSRASLSIRTHGGRRLKGADAVVTPACRPVRSVPPTP